MLISKANSLDFSSSSVHSTYDPYGGPCSQDPNDIWVASLLIQKKKEKTPNLFCRYPSIPLISSTSHFKSPRKKLRLLLFNMTTHHYDSSVTIQDAISGCYSAWQRIIMTHRFLFKMSAHQFKINTISTQVQLKANYYSTFYVVPIQVQQVAAIIQDCSQILSISRFHFY